MENSLMHYGRKGMKWGQHIYGDKKKGSVKVKKKYTSPTADDYSDEATNKIKRGIINQNKLDNDYEESVIKNDPERRAKQRVIDDAKFEDEYNKYSPEGRAKALAVERLGNAKDIASSVGGASKEAANLANQIGRFGGATKQAKTEARTLSNAELRSRIERINLEQQYKNLHPGKVKRGAAITGGVLSAVGSVALITAAGFQVAKTIKDWK